MDTRETNIHAEGHEHRVAGHNYYENHLFFVAPAPAETRPGLIPCPACELGLSPQATRCPRCGHDFTVAAMQAQRKSRAWSSLMTLSLTTIVVTALNAYTGAFTMFDGLPAYATMLMWWAVGVGYLWFLWRFDR